LCTSAILAIGINVLWQVKAAQQTRLRRASEYADWVYSPLPNALKAPNGAMSGPSFAAARQELITWVRYGNQARGPADKVLLSAEAIKRGILKPPGEMKSMFGNPQIQIYPSFVTFAKTEKKDSGQKVTKGLTDLEKTTFGNFATYITSPTYAQVFKASQDHTEHSLANVLGLGRPVASAEPFDVPWMYVASKAGAIAVFPGTTVIAQDRWEVTSRPWYMAAFGGDSQFFGKGPLGDDLLTVTYLDVLGQSPMLVRTYMYKFTSIIKQGNAEEAEEFVIAIDLKRRDQQPPDFFASDLDYNSIFSTALLPNYLGAVHYWVFATSLLLFALLRWLTATRDVHLAFKLSRSIIGDVNLEQGLDHTNEDQRAREQGVAVKFGKYLSGRLEKSRMERDTVSSVFRAETTHGTVRGVEEWKVYQAVTVSWHLLWARFEYTNTLDVGRMRLVYTSDVLPEASWVWFNSSAFSEPDEADLRSSLPTFLQRNADQCDDFLEMPESNDGTNLRRHPPHVPELVRSVVNVEEVLAIRQRRIYTRMSGERINELYSKGDVKAVMASGYFEHLLDKEDLGFLVTGRTISRVIAFPEKSAALELTPKSRLTLADLLDRYSASSRSLRRVDVPITDESTDQRLRPVYDFAIINDKFVFVAHFIWRFSGIDNASGREMRSGVSVDGYLSWRPADVQFYRAVFKRLAEQSVEFRPTSIPGLPINSHEDGVSAAIG